MTGIDFMRSLRSLPPWKLLRTGETNMPGMRDKS